MFYELIALFILYYALSVMYGKVLKEKLIPGLADEIFNDSWTREYTFKIIFKMKVRKSILIIFKIQVIESWF